MQRLQVALSTLILTALLMGCAEGISAAPKAMREKVVSTGIPTPTLVDPPTDCPVTKQQDPPFVAPEPYLPEPRYQNYFWHGSEELWTMLPVNGAWAALPHNPEGYTQKIFWWRDGYTWNEEPVPDMKVSGERLDRKAPSFVVTQATNAYADDIGSAMLTGVDFPTLGCWKITGRYGKAALSFVIWVAP
jgi:hypothetical protein